MNDPPSPIVAVDHDYAEGFPAIVGEYTPRAIQCLEDWFFGEIGNDNTRMAYQRALKRFAAWSSERSFTYRNMRALYVREYIRQLEAVTSRPVLSVCLFSEPLKSVTITRRRAFLNWFIKAKR